MRSFLVIAAGLLSSTALAAVESVGPGAPQTPVNALRATTAAERAAFKAPELEAALLELPDTHPKELPASVNLQSAGVDRVGYVEPLGPELAQNWVWTTRADGTKAAHIRLRSNRACGLRIRFENLDASRGTQIRLRDAGATHAMGPFTSPKVDDAGGWWSPTVWGEEAEIELFDPDGLIDESSSPRIAKIAYVYGGCNVFPQDTLSCHNDINCQGAWATDEGRAVALFFNIKDDTCIRWTGALLNRQPGDFAPLFMTSNFACGTDNEADTVEAYWDYTTNSCNGSAPTTPANKPRNNGALRLKRHVDSDWSLLALIEPVAAGNPFYLGWSSAQWSGDEFAAIIHHPGGSHRRISFGDTGTQEALTLCLTIPPFGCFDVQSRRVQLDNGLTELGSTGGPIMDATGAVRLVLSGRESDFPTCTQDPWLQFGGRLDLAFDNLRYVLTSADIASPMFVDNSVAGDPGNNGATEKGTAASPYDTVHEAVYIVRAGDEIRIDPGVYNETFRAWRPATLKRSGASGTVRIGG